MVDSVYTYRGGKKLTLNKRPDQFVVRALPDDLLDRGMRGAEQVSSASSRVTVQSSDLEPAMDEARQLAPTHHAYDAADTGDEFLITDRVLVKFKQALPSTEVDAFAAQYALINKEKYGDRDYLFQLTDHTNMNPVKLVVKLMENEALVELAEHDLNRRVSTYQFVPPTDPKYLRQWHLHTRMMDSSVDPRSSSHCEDAWRLLDGFGSAEVVVGVTDDGCKLDHPDFDGPGKLASWGYFRGERLITQLDIDANPAEMYIVHANHGTSCAGVIGGEADAVMTVGAAPGCALLPIQWESSGPSLFISDSKMLTVLNYVSDKVDVLSNSWGGVPDNRWAGQVVSRIQALAQSGGRRGRGIVFLWAAGNENCPIEHSANVDVPYTDGWRMQGGAAVWVGTRKARVFQNNLVGVPGVMHVAALASIARRSHYSNYGNGIGLCAPTSNAHGYRRMTVGGRGVTTATGQSGGVTESFGGTSSATPLVAGISALVISANPELSALDVLTILKQTAAKDLDFTDYARTPPAPYDPNTSWDISPIAPFERGNFGGNGSEGTWSPWFGHGRVDAQAAVAEALRRRASQPQQTIRKASTPGLAIPDNDPAGVRDTINLGESARIAHIKIHVDITHSYIGDLHIDLTSPSGVKVALHHRNGANARNLMRSFDLSNTPGLSKFDGQTMQGDWTLFVQDLAAADTGILKKWELEIGANAAKVVDVQDAPGVAIPDNDPNGIERTLSIVAPGQIKDIEILLDITHTYIGDLEVSLVSPAGSTVVLHRRAGGDSDNLITTYSSTHNAELRALRGQPPQGVWKLKVVDLEAADAGKLNRWALKIVT